MSHFHYTVGGKLFCFCNSVLTLVILLCTSLATLLSTPLAILLCAILIILLCTTSLYSCVLTWLYFCVLRSYNPMYYNLAVLLCTVSLFAYTPDESILPPTICSEPVSTPLGWGGWLCPWRKDRNYTFLPMAGCWPGPYILSPPLEPHHASLLLEQVAHPHPLPQRARAWHLKGARASVHTGLNL